MTEKNLQRKVVDYLKERAYVVKVVMASRAGTPDIIACYKGRFVAIELKGDSGKLTALQTANIEHIRSHGGFATVIRSVQELETFLNEIT